MARKFLVATDFSTRSQRALHRACLLARQCSADLVLVHVVDDDQPPRRIEAEQQVAAVLLEELKRDVRESHGLDCETRVALGAASEGLASSADAFAADLIIVGPHRRHALRDTFFGTTAERTIRASSRPVLMTNGTPEDPYASVLLAVDFSECSANAVQAAKQLGLLAAAETTALHLLEPPGRVPARRPGTMVPEDEGRLAEAERHAREQLEAFVREAGIVAACRILGPTDELAGMAINGYAKTAKADLIVVGTHGRSGLEKLLLGSVAGSVLSDAEVDVLVVAPQAP